MKALRELTVEQSKFYSAPFITELSLLGYAVREYHGSYYVPHNLTLIVAGKLASGTNTLLDVVQEKIEPSLVAHGQNPRSSRQSGGRDLTCSSSDQSPCSTVLPRG